jgi:SOS response regulatory protein OraA/RecX
MAAPLSALAVVLLQRATRLLIGRPHSRAELRGKLLRVALRARARAAPDSGAAAAATDEADADDAAAASSGDGAGSASPADAADAALADLDARGLLDDDAYAEWHVAQRAVGPRARSRAQLTSELIARRVPRAAALGAMSAHDDALVATALAARKSRLSAAALRKHLAWKGFGRAAIESALASRRPPADTLE